MFLCYKLYHSTLQLFSRDLDFWAQVYCQMSNTTCREDRSDQEATNASFSKTSSMDIVLCWVLFKYKLLMCSLQPLPCTLFRYHVPYTWKSNLLGVLSRIFIFSSRPCQKPSAWCWFCLILRKVIKVYLFAGHLVVFNWCSGQCWLSCCCVCYRLIFGFKWWIIFVLLPLYHSKCKLWEMGLTF